MTSSSNPVTTYIHQKYYPNVVHNQKYFHVERLFYANLYGIIRDLKFTECKSFSFGTRNDNYTHAIIYNSFANSYLYMYNRDFIRLCDKNFVPLCICAQMPREINFLKNKKENKRNNMRIAADFTLRIL